MFELTFGGETAVEIGDLRLKGIIDRVDLVFNESGDLKTVRVCDYKGSSRSLKHPAEYLDGIRRNLDCQLPVYAMAAQQHFFGESNTEAVNGKTEAGYLMYERDPSKIGNAIRKSLVSMDEPGLLDDFLETLCQNIRRLKAGDFSVDPLIASYNDYESICRTTAVDRDELDNF
jgi:ATP-dependent helicase/DNAse subunit B